MALRAAQGVKKAAIYKGENCGVEKPVIPV
jgi:hypothetical protein